MKRVASWRNALDLKLHDFWDGFVRAVVQLLVNGDSRILSAIRNCIGAHDIIVPALATLMKIAMASTWIIYIGASTDEAKTRANSSTFDDSDLEIQ